MPGARLRRRAFGWMSLAADDPEFEVTARSLADAGPKGRDHAQKLVRELEQHGYLTRQRIPDPDGTPVLHYELYPIPVDDEHNTYTPSTASTRRGAFSQRNPEKLHVQAFLLVLLERLPPPWVPPRQMPRWPVQRRRTSKARNPNSASRHERC